jgi:uncharacterized protein (DUF58 family)
MLKRFKALANQLEHRIAIPSYSGGVLLGISLFFFIAATNTMAGWLYVISGIILALMGIAIFSVRQVLRGITIDRPLLDPVQAGDALKIRLLLQNNSPQPKGLLQVIDHLPPGLSQPHTEVITQISARQSIKVQYDLLAQRRGVYRWQRVQIRTGAPLGLVWASRLLQHPIQAIVHPRVLPLSHCPLIDQMGNDPSRSQLSNRMAQGATSGQTRSLRPYRWGDPTRLIHWRTSAKTGELRVRELETFTSGQRIVIALDSARSWQPEDFEQAVSAAATLYFYALKQQLQVQLWTANTGLVTGDRQVLDSLAATNPNEFRQTEPLPDLPILWLTSGGDQRLPLSLPLGSRSLLWNGIGSGEDTVVINTTEAIELQLARLGS